MKIDPQNVVHLTFCLNVYPGETIDQFNNGIFRQAAQVFSHVRKMTDLDGPFGLGLWFSDAVAAQMNKHAICALKKRLDDANMYCFTLNGFPYAGFHGSRIKDKVYLPNWADRTRLDHTIRLGRILADLLPKDECGSISTVPVGYQAHLSRMDVEKSIQLLCKAVLGLALIEQETGKRITLCLEPEPDCLLEDTDSTVHFFKKYLWTKGVAFLGSSSGIGSNEGRRLMDRHLGICLDLTHAAVNFEAPLAALEKLRKNKIPIFKIQIGAALRTKSAGRLPNGIKRFKDNVYLHQTRCMGDKNNIKKFPDIPLAEADTENGQWRTHYHIPLTWQGNTDFISTRNEITRPFFDCAVNQVGVRHFEIETYTLGIFPDKIEDDNLILAKELEWVFQMMKQ